MVTEDTQLVSLHTRTWNKGP